MSFYEVQLDPQHSYGAEFALFYSTLVETVPSRAEQRIQLASRAYRRARIDFNDRSRNQLLDLREFFIGMAGKRHSFRAKDWTDYRAFDQVITCINYAGIYRAQLQVTYDRFGAPEIRPVTKPQQNRVPVTLLRDGVPFPASGNWTLDSTRGRVTFEDDQTGHEILWSGEFDVPVRFDFDEMAAGYQDFNIFDWQGVSLLEIPI